MMTVECARFVAHLQAHAVGRARALTAKHLGVALDVSDRALRELAHEATEAGVLICAANAGYFVPATSTEVDETVGRLRSQAHEMLSRASTLARLAHDRFMPKPTSLFDGGVKTAASGPPVAVRETRQRPTHGPRSASGFDPGGAFTSRA